MSWLIVTIVFAAVVLGRAVCALAEARSLTRRVPRHATQPEIPMLNTAFVVCQLQQAQSHIRAVLDATDREPAAEGGSSPEFIGTCTRPPAGWTCSRGLGHPGPCAASPLPGPARTPEEVQDRVMALETRITALAGAVGALELIALELNTDVCMKHGLNPF